jgi:hypothetical protein
VRTTESGENQEFIVGVCLNWQPVGDITSSLMNTLLEVGVVTMVDESVGRCSLIEHNDDEVSGSDKVRVGALVAVGHFLKKLGLVSINFLFGSQLLVFDGKLATGEGTVLLLDELGDSLIGIVVG